MLRNYVPVLSLAAAALLSAGAVHAQDQDDQKRGVARISLMNGDVSVRRGDSGEWVAGVINAPLLTEDWISTGPNSRAEIQFDASNILRIGGNAEVRLADLEYNRYQIELSHGTATYRVLRATGANVEVDTPSVSVRPSKPGVFRIAVSEGGETEVMSRQGDVEVFTPRGSQWVSSGQMMVARGTQADPEFQIVGARPLDDWDRWNQERDQPFMQSQSSQYVDPANSGIYGTEELDSYGTWTDVPQYGPVWRPRVAVDWAPYRSGRWVWEDWYGWTWVSYDPWGWAPYHYGRWFFDTGFGWCWYPGARGYHHYWSPALVAWFGYGGGAGFGFGFGNVGWVPLAPFETFHPWWGRGFYGRGGFGNNIHITNVNVTNVYRNARVGNGVSGIGAGDFRAGRFSGVGRVSGDQIRTAGLVRGQMPIAPSSANLHFANRAASFTPRGNENTHFFAHQQVQAAQRIPFSQQQRAMGVTPEVNRGSAAAGGGMRQQNQMQSAPQAMRPGQNGAAGANAAGSGGWRRFGEPAAGNAGSGARLQQRSPQLENTRPSQAPSTGWQRFGTPGNTNQGGQRFGTPANRPEYAPRNNAPANNAPRYNAPANNAPRYNAPQAPRYNPPANNSPRYSAPQAPRYSAPQRSAPSYSAPRGNGGGGGGGSRPSGGGGGNRPSGGGNNGGHGRR
jgi:FecR protein